jgi:hypothetical protein
MTRRRLPLCAIVLISLPLAAPAQQPAAPAPPAATAQPDEPAPPPPNIWLPKPVADLTGLDKVSARQTPLAVKVGQSATFGSLTIAVRACMVRPPDQAPDATAYLDITDSHGTAPDFHGWMVLSDPSLSVLQHPVYDVRLAGCQT